MKKVFILCLCIASFFTINGQLPKLGIKKSKTEWELVATDPKFADVSHFYKTRPFTLKAGQGVVFFMQSTAFIPYITLMGKDGKTFGIQRPLKTENGKEARVAFACIAKLYPYSRFFVPGGDSSFQIIFTSQEENATGKFTCGYQLIDSVQMIYDDDKNSFCSRLYYLINHWQADWDILPASLWEEDGFPSDAQDEKLTETDQCLIPGNGTKFGSINTSYWDYNSNNNDYNCTYSEILYDSSWSEKAALLYSDIVNQIKKCIADKMWVFEEEKDTKDSKYGETYTSYFYIRGAAKDRKSASFKIIYTHPIKENARVVLIFD